MRTCCTSARGGAAARCDAQHAAECRRGLRGEDPGLRACLCDGRHESEQSVSIYLAKRDLYFCAVQVPGRTDGRVRYKFVRVAGGLGMFSDLLAFGQAEMRAQYYAASENASRVLFGCRPRGKDHQRVRKKLRGPPLLSIVATPVEHAGALRLVVRCVPSSLCAAHRRHDSEVGPEHAEGAGAQLAKKTRAACVRFLTSLPALTLLRPRTHRLALVT